MSEHKANVSIRARHCWRAMAVRFADGNPIEAVSIRARHCWRAMGEFLDPLQAVLVSIRARHCWRAMCRALCRRQPHRGSFNPRPPLLAGDGRIP